VDKMILRSSFYLLPGKPTPSYRNPPLLQVCSLAFPWPRNGRPLGGRRCTVGARGAGRCEGHPARGAPYALSASPPLHPPTQRGRDRFCLKEIAAQQVRTRLGSGMWKYDSELLPQRTASAARLEPARPPGRARGSVERGGRAQGPGRAGARAPDEARGGRAGPTAHPEPAGRVVKVISPRPGDG
jgi:hypothetical protein